MKIKKSYWENGNVKKVSIYQNDCIIDECFNYSKLGKLTSNISYDLYGMVECVKNYWSDGKTYKNIFTYKSNGNIESISNYDKSGLNVNIIYFNGENVPKYTHYLNKFGEIYKVEEY
jgi:hypothetical protein